MRDVINEYGKVMLVGLISGLMLILFTRLQFHGVQGVPAVISKMGVGNQLTVEKSSEIKALESYSQEEMEVVLQDFDASVHSSVDINEIFTSSSDEKMKVKIVSVRDCENADAIKSGNVVIAGDNITFEKKGIYYLTVKVAGSKTIIRDFAVAVGY